MPVVWIGYDRREHAAFEVARHSIASRTDPGVSVEALRLDRLQEQGIYRRPISTTPDGRLIDDPSAAIMSTEFANSRFFLPWATKAFETFALFVDSDIVCCADVRELFDLAARDPSKALWCVKRPDYTAPKRKKVQYYDLSYPRKNWSSVMLWNLGHDSHSRLTLKRANSLPGRELHTLCWLKDEEIGELPPEWNHLVGVDKLGENGPMPKLLHYTLGGPWLPDWKGGPLDTVWLREAQEARGDAGA